MSNHTATALHNVTTIVKPPQLSLPGLPPRTMIHHKQGRAPYVLLRTGNIGVLGKPYGVSQSYYVLSPQLLMKQFDHVRKFLQHVVGLTVAQREVTLRLLTYWAYYGNVYVKEAGITAQPGCSKATYWRTMRLLRDLGLATVINRFFLRPHAQTSNLYRFDKLLIMIARYLAEHGTTFYQQWLKPFLAMTGAEFWRGYAITGAFPICPCGGVPTV